VTQENPPNGDLPVEPPDLALAAIAERQWGIVDMRDLRRAGITRRALERRVASGRLFRLHRGVYSVTPPRLLSRHGLLMAAVKATNGHASHRAAAWLHSLSAYFRVEVTAANAGARKGVLVHRHRLDDVDTTMVDGIPCATVLRTILDCGDFMSADEVLALVNQAEYADRTALSGVEELLERSNGRRGVRALKEAVAYVSLDPDDLRSELERRFVALVRRARLPRPRANVLVEGFLVDAHWPRHRVIVELDSRRAHLTGHRFERDRAENNELQLLGYVVLRFTWRQVTTQGDTVVATLRRALAGG